MLEKDITLAIMRFLKSVPGCFCFKEHGGMYGTTGLPDIICCVNGRFVGLEVKTATGRLTKLQEVTLAKINAAGGLGVVVRSVDEVKTIIEEIRRSSG